MTKAQKITRMLPVELTQEEMLARGRELAAVSGQLGAAHADLDTQSEDWKETKKALQNAIEHLEQELRDLAQIVRSGAEDRSVECYQTRNEATGTMEVRRVDTGELVSTRQLSEDEKQATLPFDGPPPAEEDDDDSQPEPGDEEPPYGVPVDQADGVLVADEEPPHEEAPPEEGS